MPKEQQREERTNTQLYHIRVFSRSSLLCSLCNLFIIKLHTSVLQNRTFSNPSRITPPSPTANSTATTWCGRMESCQEPPTSCSWWNTWTAGTCWGTSGHGNPRMTISYQWSPLMWVCDRRLKRWWIAVDLVIRIPCKWYDYSWLLIIILDVWVKLEMEEREVKGIRKWIQNTFSEMSNDDHKQYTLSWTPWTTNAKCFFKARCHEQNILKNHQINKQY